MRAADGIAEVGVDLLWCHLLSCRHKLVPELHVPALDEGARARRAVWHLTIRSSDVLGCLLSGDLCLDPLDNSCLCRQPEQVVLNTSDQEPPPDDVAADNRKEVVDYEVRDSSFSTIHYPHRHRRQVGDAVLVADSGKDHNWEPHADELPSHVRRLQPEDDGRAHERVGGDGTCEGHRGVAVTLVLSDACDEAEEGLLVEDLCQIPEEVDSRDASKRVRDEDHNPVQEGLLEGNLAGVEGQKQIHGVSREELPTEEHNEPECDREEDANDDLGQSGVVMPQLLREASCECEGKDRADPDPEPRERPQNQLLDEGVVQLLQGKLLEGALDPDAVLHQAVVADGG
mmetsp:Transcript_61471/g.151301  ORF Transcript_61471/g.151301 Transcript_61471/m.151301 type:complete len:343 (+) Transcript_61471:703-1731(+)